MKSWGKPFKIIGDQAPKLPIRMCVFFQLWHYNEVSFTNFSCHEKLFFKKPCDNCLPCFSFLKVKLSKHPFEGVWRKIFYFFRHESWVRVHNFGHGWSEYLKIWVSFHDKKSVFWKVKEGKSFLDLHIPWLWINQLTLTCLKSTIETQEKGVKFVQRYQ